MTVTPPLHTFTTGRARCYAEELSSFTTINHIPFAMQTSSKILASLSLLLVVGHASAQATADAPIKPNPGPVDKVANAIKRGASAAATGIEKGAKAAASGVERGVNATAKGIEKGADATARGVERGARATGNAAHKVADKVGGSSGTEAAKTPASVPVVDK